MRLSKRKTVQSPGAQLKVSPKPFAETLVTGIGLCTLAGDHPFSLLGAVGALMSGVHPDPTVTVLGPESSEEVPILRAAIPEFEGIEGASERFTVIAEEAFAGLAERLPKKTTQGKTLVTILVPGKGTGRGAFLDREAMETALVALHPLLQTATFRFLPAEIGTAPLIDLCQELSEGLWDRVLFAGVDSLIDEVTCAELMSEGRLLSVGGSAGIVPGEVGVCLLLQRSAEKEGDEAALARIAGAGWSRPDERTRRTSESALAAAVEEALAQAGQSPSRLQSVVLPFGEGPSEALEWHRASRRLWPQSGQNANTCEELRFPLSLGEVGAAALPLSLALACARFDFEHPSVSAVVACERGASGERGAICLLPPRREPGKK